MLAEMCETCIFRPGNRMHLHEDRVAGMIAEATANEGVIPCHSTLYKRKIKHAVCRGFFLLHATPLLQIADRLGFIELDPAP